MGFAGPHCSRPLSPQEEAEAEGFAGPAATGGPQEPGLASRRSSSSFNHNQGLCAVRSLRALPLLSPTPSCTLRMAQTLHFTATSAPGAFPRCSWSRCQGNLSPTGEQSAKSDQEEQTVARRPAPLAGLAGKRQPWPSAHPPTSAASSRSHHHAARRRPQLRAQDRTGRVRLPCRRCCVCTMCLLTPFAGARQSVTRPAEDIPEHTL